MEPTSAERFVTRQLERPDALGTLFRGASYLLCAVGAVGTVYPFYHGFNVLTHPKDAHDVAIACFTVIGAHRFGGVVLGKFLTTLSTTKIARHWRRLDKALQDSAKNAPTP